MHTYFFFFTSKHEVPSRPWTLQTLPIRWDKLNNIKIRDKVTFCYYRYYKSGVMKRESLLKKKIKWMEFIFSTNFNPVVSAADLKLFALIKSCYFLIIVPPNEIRLNWLCIRMFCTDEWWLVPTEIWIQTSGLVPYWHVVDIICKNHTVHEKVKQFPNIRNHRENCIWYLLFFL